MKKLEQFKESKACILRDVLQPITYTPDRTHDIYTMMQSYLSDQTAASDKESILRNLANCIEGRTYEQPAMAIRDYYTKADVEELAGIMDRFINGLMEGCEDGQLPPAKALTDKAWAEITALDEKTDGNLMDTWRRDRIRGWMADACEGSVFMAMEIKNSMGGMQML